MKFKYQARNKFGEMQAGFVEAPSKDAAVNVLVGHELFVLTVESAEKKGFIEKIIEKFRRIRAKDIMIFTRQLATLMESQMPLDNALKALYQQTSSPLLKECIFQVEQDIESGLSLSQAFERQKPIFSDFYVSMIRSAEVTGKLEESMMFLASYIEREVEWKSKITGALIYPAVLLGMFVVVAGIMVVVVFPKITPVFQESGVDLPLVSKILLNSGMFIASWWWILAVVIAALAFAVIDYFNSNEGKAVWGQMILVIPVFGNLFRKIYIARFCQSLSVLIKGGIPINQAIEISADTIGNTVYKEILYSISSDVRGGALLSQLLLSNDKYFPPMVGQMTGVGETTGRLDEMMTKIADFYGKEVNSTMDNLSELIQPIMIVVIGILIALLFAAILLPIYSLTQSFKF